MIFKDFVQMRTQDAVSHTHHIPWLKICHFLWLAATSGSHWGSLLTQKLLKGLFRSSSRIPFLADHLLIGDKNWLNLTSTCAHSSRSNWARRQKTGRRVSTWSDLKMHISKCPETWLYLLLPYPHKCFEVFWVVLKILWNVFLLVIHGILLTTKENTTN